MERYFKKIILFLILASFFGCDFESSYSFIVKNSTDKTIELKFISSTDFSSGNQIEKDNNKPVVVLLKDEEKTVRIIYGPLNSSAHDCLKEHGLCYFRDLVFDTYIDGLKLDKQIWQPENWEFNKVSKHSGDYKLMITSELINKKK